MARPIVRILSRYILRQHLPPLGYAIAALTFAMLVNQVAKQFGNFVGKGLPWGAIFEVFALSIPFIVAMTLPMAVPSLGAVKFLHISPPPPSTHTAKKHDSNPHPPPPPTPLSASKKK